MSSTLKFLKHHSSLVEMKKGCLETAICPAGNGINTSMLSRSSCVLWWDDLAAAETFTSLIAMGRTWTVSSFLPFYRWGCGGAGESSFPEVTPSDKRPDALALKLQTVLFKCQRQDFSFWVEICPIQTQTDSAQVQCESKGGVRREKHPFPCPWPVRIVLSPYCANSIGRVYAHWTCWECWWFDVIQQLVGLNDLFQPKLSHDSMN